MRIDYLCGRHALLAVALLFGTATTSVRAATITVTSTADSGGGSLRSALAGAANGDVIDAGGLSGTILLTSGELVVSNNVAILGPGPAVLAVNGNGSSRVFRIAPSRTVTIAGLTITNGFAPGGFSGGFGGGIYNQHSILTVSNCTLSGNSASFSGGAIYTYSDLPANATLSLISSTIANNFAEEEGGGIYNSAILRTATITANNCTFSHNLADDGAGIYNEANAGIAAITVNNCIIRGNSADGVGGGVYNTALTDTAHARLTVLNCVITNNVAVDVGGGINNDLWDTNNVTVTVLNSVVSSNRAHYGAAIGTSLSYPGNVTLTVSNCTLSANVASGDGGAIFNKAGYDFATATLSVSASTISSNSARSGGGIFSGNELLGNATLTVTRCTFSGNSAVQLGGALFNEDRSDESAGSPPLLMVTGSTLTGNSAVEGGGGIYNSGTLQIGDTIVAGAGGTNLFNEDGTVTSLGYNLSSDNGGGWLTNTADQINTDARLGPLQNNGGPTRTHAPLAGSPAIDKGKNLSGSALDQRNFPRVVDLCPANAAGGDGSDIGAVESSSVTVDPILSVDNLNDSGTGSLREAILLANFCPDANTIVFAPSAYGMILLTSGELPIAGPLEILGPGPADVVINGNGSTRVFRIAPANTVLIAGLTITNGLANGGGGGIYNDHSILTVSNCTIIGNSAAESFGGGGIANYGAGSGSASLTVIASTLKGNLGSAGAAILNEGAAGSATVTVHASTLSGNKAAPGSGGAIFNDGQISGNASVFISASTLSSNSASVGGCIYSTGSAGTALVSINSVTFSGNTATVEGATVYNDSLFSANTTVQFGNTILNSAAPAHIANIYKNQGNIISLGYNLSSDAAGGFLNQPTDQTNTNPQLGPLQNNGGPTFTHALLTGSPAIDKGKRDAIPSLTFDIDQRGLLRPMDLSAIANAAGGDGSDIGAFEAQESAVATPMLLVGPQKVLNGPFQFFFSNTPGANFTVLTSTNIALPLSDWTVLGPPTEISPGNFQFADPQATNRPQSFYGVRSP